jgi:hypothetical protein
VKYFSPDPEMARQMSQSTETSPSVSGGRDRGRAAFIDRMAGFAALCIGLCRQRRGGWIAHERMVLASETFDDAWRQNREGPGSCAVTYMEGMKVNSQIEVDLGLTRVSEGALAMLEGVGRIPDLPQCLFSELLDALAAEHLRRFGARVDATSVFRVPTRTVDPDELWHSLRVLGNWLSYKGGASQDDPDTAAASEVIARLWLAMRGALIVATEGERPFEVAN